MFMVGVSSLLWRGGIYFRIISHDGIAMVGVLQCVGYISYLYIPQKFFLVCGPSGLLWALPLDSVLAVVWCVSRWIVC